MQAQGLAGQLRLRVEWNLPCGWVLLLATEDLAVQAVKPSVVDKLVDPAAGLEGGIQLDERFGPQKPLVELRINERTNSGVSDLEETTREVGIVANQAVTQLEDIHRLSPDAVRCGTRVLPTPSLVSPIRRTSRRLAAQGSGLD